MIKFNKIVKRLLPYDRVQYIDYFSRDDRSSDWQRISFQLLSFQSYNERSKNDLKLYLETITPLFKNVIEQFDNGMLWIVNFGRKDLPWFPNNACTLASMRNLFKQRNIPNTFKGAIMFEKNDLLEYSKDLLSYPYSVLGSKSLYQDVNISHSQLPFVIKISGILDLDFLSSSKQLLRAVVEENSSDIFIVKQYRGTSLE